MLKTKSNSTWAMRAYSVGILSNKVESSDAPLTASKVLNATYNVWFEP